MDKDCEEIPRQGKKVKQKIVAIYKTNKQTSSFQKAYVLKS